MIKTSMKFSILITLLFVLINIIYIQPETKAFPYEAPTTLPQIEATPAKAAHEAVLTPRVEKIVSTEAVNTPSEIAAATVASTTSVMASGSRSEAGSMMGAFRATAYCLKGRTAVGGSVRRGIVAADPRVLPLGSQIQIDAGAYSGTYTVTDTGGAIKGRILDIWVPNCGEANRFGRRTIKVTKLGRNSRR
jgi:3D (Asp-Asp-Asp) domain-containing protein